MDYKIIRMTNTPLNPRADEYFTVTIELEKRVSTAGGIRIALEKKRILPPLNDIRPVDDRYLEDLTVLTVTIAEHERTGTSRPIKVLKDARDHDTGDPVEFPDILVLPADTGTRFFGHLINIQPYAADESGEKR